MRLKILILFVLLAAGNLSAQQYSSKRIKEVFIASDTTVLDTLSIIPSSFRFLSLNDSLYYTIHYTRALLIRNNQTFSIDTIEVEYRVFPLMFEKEYFTKEYNKYLSPDSLLNKPAEFYRPGKSTEQPFGENIRTSGSFTRGINFGNNQDVSVTSGMNLKLSGELGSGLMIEGAISDKAIPLQPQGNTRRIEDFDRIYLRIYKDDFSLQAGDIDMMSRSKSSLLAFNRNVQGLGYKGIVKGEKSFDTLLIDATASVAKGKFARNQIQGTEGNQGPYRLTGSAGEPFIIVISGSERVYVDGILLTRGEDAHYVIDYNVAEITFTTAIMINRNSRIVVEFEYSERSYARFNTHAGVEHRGAKWQWHLSGFSEMDAKNQPYDQDLSNEQKQLLASIGDNLNDAFIPQIDSVAFNPDVILYQKVDSLVNGTTYTIYRYSTNPQLAHFRVIFSYVGEGNGDYVAEFGNANGRVYKWVSPENGEKQGNYMPTRRLVSPSKKQMFTGGVGRKWGNGSGAQIDYALSNNDLNTFSPLDSGDDVGHAVRGSFIQRFANNDNTTEWRIGGNFLKSTASFRTIDRFREVEFERNWSINSNLNGGNEQQLGAFAEILVPQKHNTIIGFESFEYGDVYDGKRATLTGWQKVHDFRFAYDGFLVSSSDTTNESYFAKGKITIDKTLKIIKLGVFSEVEKRLTTDLTTDTITQRSFQWYSFRAFAITPDTLPQKLDLSYTFRTDYLPYNKELVRSGTSHDFMLKTEMDSPMMGRANLSVGYRMLSPTKEFSAIIQDEKTFLGKIEYSKRFWKGGWVLSGGYELGSGQEPTTEYYFVEVPAGQGVFTWNDYNSNGIKELDEFEVARFPDEAKYIRLNFLGSKMIRVKNNTLSVRSNINPASTIKSEKGILRFIGRWTNNTSYMVKQKNRFTDFWESANPFHSSLSDSLITSSSSIFRNSLAFNRSNRKVGAEYIFTKSNTKSMLSNGFELRDALSNRILLWIGPGDRFTIRMETDLFVNSAKSQYFQNRNFNIKGTEPSVSLRYKSMKNFSLEATYRWFVSKNTLQTEKASGQGFSLQSDLAIPNRISFIGKISMIINDFSGQASSPIAYEMLKGLQPGRNWVWETTIRRKLSTYFELEVGYGGRILNNGKVVHTGSMQARALF